MTIPPTGQLVVNEPGALVALNTQRILVQAGSGAVPSFDDSQWSDSVPKLVQAKLVEGFENAGFDRVGNDTQGLVADHQLMIDIRAFGISTEPAHVASVEFSAKLATSDGQIVASKSFLATAPVAGEDAAPAAAALNQAFGAVATDLVKWALATL